MVWNGLFYWSCMTRLAALLASGKPYAHLNEDSYELLSDDKYHHSVLFIDYSTWALQICDYS